MPDIESESLRSFSSNDREVGDTISAVLDWAVLIMEIFWSAAKKYARKAVPAVLP